MTGESSATDTAPAAAAVPTDVLEERVIDEEYKVCHVQIIIMYQQHAHSIQKELQYSRTIVITHSYSFVIFQQIWKKNTPFLYDYVMTHSLEWPSLTCQWLPKPRSLSPTLEEHSLLIGTHTTGEQNYLMVASCALPTNPKKTTTTTGSTTTNNTTKKQPAPEYDEEKGEMGGFGLGADQAGKIEIKMKLPHEGEVNRARIMPQNPFIVASRGPQPDIYLWDRSKHTSFPAPGAVVVAPQAVCVGHEKEGYGMVWSPHTAGHLATASEDSTVKLWDVSCLMGGKTENGHKIQPMATLTGHSGAVEDVDWHAKDPQLVASVGGDRKLCLWDVNNPTKPHYVVPNAHANDINSVAFNPQNEFVLATGSSDKTIGIWDVRRLDQKLHSLEGHTDDVFTIQWAPHDEAVLASCSADRRVIMWDLSRIGDEQSSEDAEDGPPELLFIHGGHTSKVSDLSWNPHAPWTMASASEDNILQIWTMAEEIYANEDTDDRENNGLKPNELE